MVKTRMDNVKIIAFAEKLQNTISKIGKDLAATLVNLKS